MTAGVDFINICAPNSTSFWQMVFSEFWPNFDGEFQLPCLQRNWTADFSSNAGNFSLDEKVWWNLPQESFFREGQKISQEGEEPYLPKNSKKDPFFSQKSRKTYDFWPALIDQGVQEPPFPTPISEHIWEIFIHLYY